MMRFKFHLTGILFFSFILAQEEVVILSKKVGWDIDVHENRFYEIFPDEKGFLNAQIIQLSKNKFRVSIIKEIRGKNRRVRRYISLKEFASLQNHVNMQPEFTEEARTAMYKGMDFLRVAEIVNGIPKPQYVVVNHSEGKILKGSLIVAADNILQVQTPTNVEMVDLSDVDAMTYRTRMDEYDYLKPWLIGISGSVGFGLARLYNSQRSTIYNEYGVPRTDLKRYTEIYGIVLGLIFSSELFDAVSTLLTSADTIILSKAQYDKEKIK